MKQEDIYGDVIRKAFAKAEKDYVTSKKYKLSEHISEEVQELTKLPVHPRTFVNYYKKYIEKKEVATIPKHENIELLCKYLGYANYKEYLQTNYSDKNTPEPASIPKQPNTAKEKITLGLLWILVLAVATGVSYSILTPKQTNECMVWKSDHYEITACNGESNVIALDQETLKGMKQLMGLCKDDTFFLPDDTPVVWYDKFHNKLTFFTKEGIHPTNRRTLKPITQYIKDKYVPECPNK